MRLERRPLSGPATVLASLPTRWDSFHTYALENDDGATSFYFERRHCKTHAQDVLKVVDP